MEASNTPEKQESSAGPGSSSSLSSLLVQAFGDEIVAYQKYLGEQGKLLSIETILRNHIDGFTKFLRTNNKEQLLTDLLQQQGKDSLVRDDIKDIGIHGLGLLERGDRILAELVDTQTQKVLYLQQLDQLQTIIAGHADIVGFPHFKQYVAKAGLPISYDAIGDDKGQQPRNEAYLAQLAGYARAYIDMIAPDSAVANDLLSEVYAQNTFSLSQFEKYYTKTIGGKLTHAWRSRAIGGGKKRHHEGTIHAQGVKKRQQHIVDLLYPDQQKKGNANHADEVGADSNLSGLFALSIEQDIIERHDILQAFEQDIEYDLRQRDMFAITIAPKHSVEVFLRDTPGLHEQWQHICYTQTVDEEGNLRLVAKDTPTAAEQAHLQNIYKQYYIRLLEQDERYAPLMHIIGDDITILSPEEREKKEHALIDAFVERQLETSKQHFYERYLPFYAGEKDYGELSPTAKEGLRQEYRTFIHAIYDPTQKRVPLPGAQPNSHGATITFSDKKYIVRLEAFSTQQIDDATDDPVTFVYTIDAAATDPVCVQVLRGAGLYGGGISEQPVRSALENQELGDVLDDNTSNSQVSFRLDTHQPYQITTPDGQELIAYPHIQHHVDLETGERTVRYTWYPYPLSQQDPAADEAPLMTMTAEEAQQAQLIAQGDTDDLVLNMTSEDRVSLQMLFFSAVQDHAKAYGHAIDPTGPSQVADKLSMIDRSPSTERDEIAEFDGNLVLKRSADVPEALYKKEQTVFPDSIQSKQDIHAWIEEGEIVINQDYLEQKLGVRITQAADGIYLIDGTPAREHEQFRDIAREVIRLRNHEIAHRYFTFYELALGKGGKDIALELADGESHTFSQEELCRLAEGHYTYVNPHTSRGAKEDIEFFTDDGETIVFSKTVLEEQISDIIGHPFSFTALRQLDLAQREQYAAESEKFHHLLAASAGGTSPDKTEELSDKELLSQIVQELRNIKGYLKNMEQGLELSDSVSGKIASLSRSIEESEHSISLGDVLKEEEIEQVYKKLFQHYDTFFDLIDQRYNEIDSNIKKIKKSEKSDKLSLSIDELEEEKVGLPERAYHTAKSAIQHASHYVTNIQNGEDPEDDERVRTYTRKALFYNQKLQEQENDGARMTQLQQEERDMTQQLASGKEDENNPESQILSVVNLFNEKIKGDSELNIEHIEELDGKLLFFRGPMSMLPGHGTQWIKTKLHYNGGDHFTIEFLDGSEGGAMPPPVDMPLEGDVFKKMIDRFGGEVYKLPQVDSLQGVLKDLMDLDILGGTHKANRGGYTVREDTGEKMAEVDEQDITAPIRYVGRDNGMGIFEFYSIEKKGDTVSVKLVQPQSHNFSQEMDRTTFYLFANDKGLSPYTQAEYKQIQATTDMPEKAQRNWTDSFMSIRSIIAAFKKFPEAYKYKLEQQEKFESAKLYASLASRLPAWSIFYLEDIQADAESELDSSIRQVIQQHKERLGRNDGGESSSVHKKMAALRIEKEIFKRMGTGEQFRLKAAGYLLYALDQGNMYFRELAHYADDGMWVKALLGSDYQAAFKEERKKRYEQLKNLGWEEEEAMADLMNFEIQFIADNTTSPAQRSLYGSQFGKKVEAATEGEMKDLEKAKSGISSKTSFYEVYRTMEGGIAKLEPSKMVAGLEVMLERMEYPHHYDLANRVIIQMYASGVLANTIRAGMKGKLKQLGRTFGMPLLLMAKNMNATMRVTYMMDALSDTAGIHPTLSEYISAHGWSGYDADDVTMSNFTEYKGTPPGGEADYKGAKHAIVAKAAGKWRDQFGKVMIDAINGKNSYYREAMNREDIGEKQQKSLEYFYESKMHDAETNIDAGFNKDVFRSENAPNFAEGIMHLSPSTFRGVMLQTQGGRLKDQTAENMWIHLKNKINQFSNDIDVAHNAGNKKVEDTILHFVTKKFFSYFGSDGRVSETELQNFQVALKEGGVVKNVFVNGKQKDLSIENFLKEKFLKSMGMQIDSGTMVEGVEAYIKFFEEHRGKIQELSHQDGMRMRESFV